MHTHQEEIEVASRGRGFYDLTAEVRSAVTRSGIVTGVCSIFVRHTSASLVIQENADPAVLRDLERWFAELAPEARNWEHDQEGPDDMPAHARSALTRSSETVPVSKGRLALGTWQAIYLWEHRSEPQSRAIVISIWGNRA